MIDATSMNETRKEIQKLKGEGSLIVVQAQGDEYNRKIFENPDVDIVLGLEIHNRRDYQKQRDSGLNEVLCKLAKKNNIKIGINLKEIVKLSKKEKAIVLARLIQNIQLCKRIGTKIVFYPRGIGKQEALSLITTLRGSTEQVKNSIGKFK